MTVTLVQCYHNVSQAAPMAGRPIARAMPPGWLPTGHSRRSLVMPSRAGRNAGRARGLRPFPHPFVVVLREHAVPSTRV